MKDSTKIKLISSSTITIVITAIITFIAWFNSLSASTTLRSGGPTYIQFNPTNVWSGLKFWQSFDGKDVNWTSATACSFFDRSGNANNGTTTGASRTDCPVAGKHGQGYNVTTVLNFGHGASIADLQLQGGGGMTVSFWIKRTTATATGTVITKGNFVGGAWDIQKSAENFYFTKDLTNASGPDVWITWPSSFNATNQWQHFCMTWNGGTNKSAVQLFRDGTQWFGAANIVAGNAPPVSDAASDLTIRTGASAIDEVMIWNRVLSNDEIYFLATGNYALIGNTGMKPSTNIIDADLYLEGQSVSWTNGAPITAARLTEGCHDNIGGTWTVIGAAPITAYVTNTSFQLYSPVRVNGVTYNNLGGLNGVAFLYTNTTANVRYTLPAIRTNLVMGGWVSFADTADSGLDLDRFYIDSNTNISGEAVCALNSALQVLRAHGQDGAPFVFGNPIPYVPFKAYWVNFGRWMTNATPNKCTAIVELYDPMRYSERLGGLALVGHSECTINMDTVLAINFGNYNDASSNTNNFPVYGDFIIGVGANARMPFGP